MRCSEHRENEAGWRCTECKKLLCGECTAQIVKVFECGHCEALATQFTEPRVDKPFATWVIDAIAYPIRNVLVTAVVAALMVALIKLEGRVVGAQIAQVAAVAVTGLLVIVSAARRRDAGRARMFGKTIATTALLWVPIAGYVALSKHALNDELAVLVAGLGAVYAPAALATSATDVSIAQGLNPFAIFEWIWRVKVRYVAFVITSAAFGFAAVKVSMTTLRVASQPLINEAVTTVTMIALGLAACRMLGNFVFVHGESFDFGPDTDYVDPLHPEIVAVAGRKGKYGIGKDGIGKDAANGGSSPVYGTGNKERLEAAAIRRSLAKDELAPALKLYKKRESWSDGSFNPKVLLDLGTAAAKSKEHDLAIALLSQASETPGPIAARAMFRLARLYETAADKREAAIALYRRIVDEHPTSDLVRAAKLRLEEVGP